MNLWKPRAKFRLENFKTSLYAKDWRLHRQKRKTYGAWAAIIYEVMKL